MPQDCAQSERLLKDGKRDCAQGDATPIFWEEVCVFLLPSISKTKLLTPVHFADIGVSLSKPRCKACIPSPAATSCTSCYQALNCCLIMSRPSNNLLLVAAEWHGLPEEYRITASLARQQYELQAFLATPVERLPEQQTANPELTQENIRNVADPHAWVDGKTIDEAFLSLEQRQIAIEALSYSNLRVPCRSRVFESDFYSYLMCAFPIPLSDLNCGQCVSRCCFGRACQFSIVPVSQ